MPSVIRGSDNFDPANMPAIPTVSITAGTIANGGTIPLPSGYTREQCKYAVWIQSFNTATCYTVQVDCIVNQSTGVVSSQTRAYYEGSWDPFEGKTAGYLCIGVK